MKLSIIALPLLALGAAAAAIAAPVEGLTMGISKRACRSKCPGHNLAGPAQCGSHAGCNLAPPCHLFKGCADGVEQICDKNGHCIVV